MDSTTTPCRFLFVCVGPTCGERGGRPLLAGCRTALAEEPRRDEARITPVQCFGECATGPNALLHPQGRFMTGIDPGSSATLIELLVAGSAAGPTCR